MSARTQDSVASEYVADSERLATLLDDWRGTPVLAMDTEFERTVTYYARPALLQLRAEGLVLLVDLRALDDLHPLFELFADPGTTKVIHSGSEDMEVLTGLEAPRPEPLFDTQVAAAMAGVGYSLSYAALVAEMLGVEVSKDQSRSDWLARPLSAAQLHYAEQDVVWLPELYRQLHQRLLDNGRLAWLEEECSRIVATGFELSDPTQAWRRLRGARALSGRAHAVLRGLAAWRESEARARNRPRNHVVKEAVLFELAERRPESLGALAEVPGMPAAETRRSGAVLLEAIASAREGEDDQPSPLASRAASEVLKRMKKEVRQRAQALDLEPSLLAPNRLLEALLVNVAREVTPCLPEELQGWRREPVGEALLECARVEWSRRMASA